MPDDDAIREIMERISRTRDRYENAGDEARVELASYALSALEGLTDSQIDIARQIEINLDDRMVDIHARPRYVQTPHDRRSRAYTDNS